ncbi:hypothetical protein NM688_g1191 [Phlebia brevispora]|uniref:Uncharacterized protein n=1 Tax=Phlebia brevispora TaxID=194682 RepID=A0ACC1TCY5_9APHY|nr:hypothetical protein NM688_g1191 [Phlebia brevispora]
MTGPIILAIYGICTLCRTLRNSSRYGTAATSVYVRFHQEVSESLGCDRSILQVSTDMTENMSELHMHPCVLRVLHIILLADPSVAGPRRPEHRERVLSLFPRDRALAVDPVWHKVSRPADEVALFTQREDRSRDRGRGGLGWIGTDDNGSRWLSVGRQGMGMAGIGWNGAPLDSRYTGKKSSFVATGSEQLAPAGSPTNQHLQEHATWREVAPMDS